MCALHVRAHDMTPNFIKTEITKSPQYEHVARERESGISWAARGGRGGRGGRGRG